MPARHFDTITADLIFRRLLAAESATVEWLGTMPIDAEDYDRAANDRLADIRVAHVWAQLELHDILGENPTDEVEAAIALAAEPPYLPNCGAVAVTFRAARPAPVASVAKHGPAANQGLRPFLGQSGAV